ncbi:MAG: redox protein [Thermosynechococcaceae cyanobacterium]
MFDLVTYRKFRDTPQVRFFDITVDRSDARDLVFHDGPAVSPNNDPDGFWQFYMHPNQEDNLLALTGGRTFYLVNFQWDHPYHMVRLEAGGEILRIPPGTFHRSISDPNGSLVLNQAIRTAATTIEKEFRVYNSAEIPRLRWVTSQEGVMPEMHGFTGPICRAA